MSNTDTPAEQGEALSFMQRFSILTGCFFVLLAVSIPNLLSFHLWVWQDRGNFLNLDYLLADHHRLGVDVCYSYGLLPVLLQHLAFEVFGRGYKPMIGFTLIALVVTALFWTSLLEHLPRHRFWLAAVAVLTPMILWVNPNFPYTLAVLSILFALLFVLKERLDLAFAISTIGCFSVPSLPLVLTVLLATLIVAAWWTGGDRRISQLVRQLAPGILSYVLLAGLLAAFFGVESVEATALPIAGTKYYQSSGYGSLGAFFSFVYPTGHSLKYLAAYYVGSAVTWFCVCTLLLMVFAVRALMAMVRQRHVLFRESFVFLAGSLQLVFILVAYGSTSQHRIYQPVLAAGTLIGAALLPSARVRRWMLIAIIGLGVLGETGQAYQTYASWRTTKPGPDTLGLYEDPAFAAEWSAILHHAGSRKVLVLSYGTGVHNYYPQVDSPKVWFLLPGLLYPSDMQRLLGQIQRADIVVEEMTTSTALVDYNSQVQGLLAPMHQTSSTDNFRVWQRVSEASDATKPR